MKVDKYQILTPELINELKEKLEDILKPIQGVVDIEDKPITVFCKSRKDGREFSEWEVYYYTINIKTNIGNLELQEEFPIHDDLQYKAYNLAITVWEKLDKNFYSTLADKIFRNNK